MRLPVLLQLAGGLAAVVGVTLLWGAAVAALAGGLALIAIGTLAELHPAPSRRRRDDGAERYTS